MEFFEVRGVFLSWCRAELQVGVDCDVQVVFLVSKEG